MSVENLPYRITQTAVRLFREEGFDRVNLDRIAREAGLSEATLYRYFGSKKDILLFLYGAINADWRQQVAELPPDKLALRFQKALRLKTVLVAPYAAFLGSIAGMLLQDGQVAVDAPDTASIRAIGLQTIHTILEGATDARNLQQKIADLPALLYLLHWGVLFLQLQTQSVSKTEATIALIGKLLKKAVGFSALLPLFPLLQEVGNWAGNLTAAGAPRQDASLEKELLKILFRYRKIQSGMEACAAQTCATCFALHESEVAFFTARQQPLQFILPAFPAKSPNPEKVLGKLPDLGEEIALHTLQTMCEEMGSLYSPGAQVIICSDGRIFSELVGVTDADITAYVAALREMIATHNLHCLRIVNLEDLMEGDSFDALRQVVLDTYAEPLEDLRERRKHNEGFQNLFNGMHRFVVEDQRQMHPDIPVSRIKEASKDVALKIIRNSNAWTRLLTYMFPHAIRLSIHPYPAHDAKIGIRLTRAADNWLTPWHGVIVLEESGYVLMKRTEAEARGAKKGFNNGLPYYYTLIPERNEL